MNPKPAETLTISLGFNGSLKVLYPNGRHLELPIGQAEARLREILEGFRKPLKTLQKEVEASQTAATRVTRLGSAATLRFEELEEALGLSPQPSGSGTR